ncbi:hypothetical protein GCM10027290_13810 [Micromonospora sonneratiae]
MLPLGTGELPFGTGPRATPSLRRSLDSIGEPSDAGLPDDCGQANRSCGWRASVPTQPRLFRAARRTPLHGSGLVGAGTASLRVRGTAPT